MSKLHHNSLHLVSSSPHRFPSAYQPRRSDPVASVPLPLHPDPVQTFSSAHDPDPDRFSFPRHTFLDDIPHDDPTHSHFHPPNAADSNDHANALTAVDTLRAPLAMSPVPAIQNVPLSNIPQTQTVLMPQPSIGNASIVGGASELVEGLSIDRKCASRRLPHSSRSRAQQMTESQRKQRHNEHTRASRSRIDRGLERLKSVIKKVKPHQKVTKKADVLQQAVKLLKESFRLPPTESDEEREDPAGITLAV